MAHLSASLRTLKHGRFKLSGTAVSHQNVFIALKGAFMIWQQHCKWRQRGASMRTKGFNGLLKYPCYVCLSHFVRWNKMASIYFIIYRMMRVCSTLISDDSFHICLRWVRHNYLSGYKKNMSAWSHSFIIHEILGFLVTHRWWGHVAKI